MATFTAQSTVLKTILITGVNSGIGHYFASTLARRGYRVIGTCRSPERLDPGLLALPGFIAIGMSLDSDESINQAFHQVREHCDDSGLYALINNAGIVSAGPLSHIGMEEVRHQFQVNVMAPLRLVQCCFELLRRQAPQSRIINISSISGLFASPFIGAYVGSKFALEGLSDSLRRELALVGIRVVLIEPGSIRSPIWRKQLGIGQLFSTSPYAAFIASADERIEDMERQSRSPEYLLPSILHALESPSPRARYLVHPKKWLIRLMVNYLPTTFVDRLVERNLRSSQQAIRPF
ncbi:MAG: SDR family NAD(P)-dependent oxidoreductase [Saprospiraceae bacterium]|nr:SDR family NAD(P)-dependent oxidoreductase [Saprospiraceae bacterium]